MKTHPLHDNRMKLILLDSSERAPQATYSQVLNIVIQFQWRIYVNAVRAIVCFELPAQEASNFPEIWKFTTMRFHRMYFLICI